MRITIEVLENIPEYWAKRAIRMRYQHAGNDWVQMQLLEPPYNVEASNDLMQQYILTVIKEMLQQSWKKLNPYFLKG